MNRHQRRAEAAKARAAKARHDLVRIALDCMAARNDPTISGATLMLPDGQMLHIGADALRTTPKPGGVQ